MSTLADQCCAGFGQGDDILAAGMGSTWTVIIPAEAAAFDLSTDRALGEPEAVRDGLLAEMARMGVDDGEHEEISTRRRALSATSIPAVNRSDSGLPRETNAEPCLLVLRRGRPPGHHLIVDETQTLAVIGAIANIAAVGSTHRRRIASAQRLDVATTAVGIGSSRRLQAHMRRDSNQRRRGVGQLHFKRAMFPRTFSSAAA